MNDIRLCGKDNCTGCMACKQKCKHDAIAIQTIEGFDYPLIISDKCVRCGLCVSVCPVINVSGTKGRVHSDDETCIAAWSKDDEIRMKSSSGGTFSALAEYIISEGGVVYGAGWDEKMRLVHQHVERTEDLDKLRKSKYVQSDTREAFNEVRAFLKEGRKVLFCGTPCQCAGLRMSIGNHLSENLYVVDLLCQGVPSPHYFRKYLNEVEIETKLTITDCDFRSKKYGWRCGLLLLLKVTDGVNDYWIKRVLSNNEYYNSFIREYFMRPSCYQCIFKNERQGYYSDMTVADFWRIGNKIPFEVSDYEKGISAIVINTLKGKQLLEHIKGNMNLRERTWKEFSTNGGLKSSRMPINNNEAFKYLTSHSWAEVQRYYFPVTWRKRIQTILYLTLGEKKIRAIMKSLRII